MDIPYAGGSHGNQAAPFGISGRPAPPPSSCAISRFIWIFIIRAEVSLTPCHHCLQDRYAFYLDVRGEEIGMIEQMQMLELFEQNMAPIIYNRALDDAKAWFTQMMDNLDSDFYALYKND